MVDLYSERTCQVAADAADGQRSASLSHLSKREQSFYEHLTKHGVTEFRLAYRRRSSTSTPVMK